MSYEQEIDIVIIGGGIAGLWLLDRLRSRGYDVLLVEGDQLGAGQTIRSQGIVRSGNQYTLNRETEGAAQVLSDMPVVWRQCLAGQGEINLSETKVLSSHQYIWVPEAYPWRFLDFFRRKGGNRPEVVNDELPEILRYPRQPGNFHCLDEPVLDTASLLQTLARPHREAMVRNQNTAVPAPDGAITLRAPEREPVVVRPRYTVFAAGVGNTFLGGAPIRTRPLHMVMIRGERLPPDLYIHSLATDATPYLTLTSHRDDAGRTVWYLGGQFAEIGMSRSTRQQISAARRELVELLPKESLADARFATFITSRIEVRRRDRKQPPVSRVFHSGRSITVCPTSLAMVPTLVGEVMILLEREDIQPRSSDLSLLADWPRPEVAVYPWNEEEEEWY